MIRWLAFILIFACSAVAQDDARSIQNRALEAFDGGDYSLAEALLTEQIGLTPSDFVPYYNLACALSMQGRTDDAMHSLLDAVEHGFADIVQLQRDHYLENLRSHAQFQPLIDRWDAVLKARADAEMKHLRSTFKTGYLFDRDDRLRAVFACGYSQETFDSARAEMDKVSRYAATVFGDDFAQAQAGDAWFSVVLPNREHFIGWAVKTFGSSAVSGSQGIGGQYDHDRKQLVAQDLGSTLRHEYFHALHWRHATRLGQQHPTWIMEGMACLVEDLEPINGRLRPVPSWRTNIAKRIARIGRTPKIEKFAAAPRKIFLKGRPMAHYAQARAFFMYLDDQGKLGDFYDHYIEHYEQDPTGAESVRAVLGQPWKQINRDYRLWLMDLEEVPESIEPGMASIGIAIEPGAGDGPVVAEVILKRSGLNLMLGDVITGIDGRPTRDMAELVRVLSDYSPGDTVEISYRRRAQHGSTHIALVEKK